MDGSGFVEIVAHRLEIASLHPAGGGMLVEAMTLREGIIRVFRSYQVGLDISLCCVSWKNATVWPVFYSLFC